MALFAAARIAQTSVNERSAFADDPSILVGDLYSDEELPYRGGFRLRRDEAVARWEAGMDDLSRMAIVAGVSAMDDLLGEVIRLLRAMGHDSTSAGAVSTSVSEKLEHLVRHGGLDLDSDTRALYRLLIAVRNAVTHHGSRQRPVKDAWRNVSDQTRDWWATAGGRALELTDDADSLNIGDRELLAALKTLDRVGLSLAAALRNVLDEEDWADLIVAEYRQRDLARANDPFSNTRRILTFARTVWRFDLDRNIAEAALAKSTPPQIAGLSWSAA